MRKETYPRSLRSVDNTGFSANSSIEGTRLINRDGFPNLRKTGIPFWERISIYHSLLRLKRGRFLLLVFAFYTSINLIFATLYYLIGVEHLAGTEGAVTPFQKFLEGFFFSSQSLTTVGYGHVAPIGMMSNAVASFESLVGILVFALVTGIFYGRFSRPRAYLKFSEHFLITPYRGGRALMLRLATYKNNNLTDAEAQLTAALHLDDGGKRVTKFFPIKMEISKVTALSLSWTIVHPINEESPMYGFSEEDFIQNRLEIIINIKAFDDHFSNTVQQRTSFTYREMVFGAKFIPMFERPDNGSYTVLELDKISEYEMVDLPDAQEIPQMEQPSIMAAKV